MAKAIQISQAEMDEFLTSRGFTLVQLEGVLELVYGKIVAPGLCLRVYSTIDVRGGGSRDVGADAIRTVLFSRFYDTSNGQEPVTVVRPVGQDKRVHRVEGWKKNLQDRLDNWQAQLGPVCPKCGRHTVKRKSKISGKPAFWGCSAFPVCRSIQEIQE